MLTAGPDITHGTSALGWEVQVGSATRGIFTFPLQLVPPFVSGVSPSAGVVPLFGRPGTTVAITRNEGEPTSYALQLASFDSAGRPTSFTAPTASVGQGGQGDTVTFNPNWGQLGTGSGILSIRTAAGEVTNSAL